LNYLELPTANMHNVATTTATYCDL